jgi:hypothetical protein
MCVFDAATLLSVPSTSYNAAVSNVVNGMCLSPYMTNCGIPHNKDSYTASTLHSSDGKYVTCWYLVYPGTYVS